MIESGIPPSPVPEPPPEVRGDERIVAERRKELQGRRRLWLGRAFSFPVIVVLYFLFTSPQAHQGIALGIYIAYLLWVIFCSLRVVTLGGKADFDWVTLMGGALAAAAIMLLLLIGIVGGPCSTTKQ